MSVDSKPVSLREHADLVVERLLQLVGLRRVAQSAVAAIFVEPGLADMAAADLRRDVESLPEQIAIELLEEWEAGL